MFFKILVSQAFSGMFAFKSLPISTRLKKTFQFKPPDKETLVLNYEKKAQKIHPLWKKQNLCKIKKDRHNILLI